MDEKQLQHKVLKHLQDNNHYARKIIVSNKAGTPDIFACIEGIFVGIEVKGAGKEASLLQKYNLKDIIKSGGLSTVVDSWDKYIEFYKLIIKKSSNRGGNDD